MRVWWVLDSYGCEMYRTDTLRQALAWTVPPDHRERPHPCTICSHIDLGGGVHEVKTCEGVYTITRHAPDSFFAATTPEADADGRPCCEAEYEWADGSGSAVCDRPMGHDGDHHDPIHDYEWTPEADADGR